MKLYHSEKMQILRSAGYSVSGAQNALQIGVLFFESLEELQNFLIEIEEPGASYDKGYFNNKEYYFLDTSIC